jgi:hypothetical protein
LRKIAAISLVILLLFNLFGYRLFITLLQQHSTEKLNSRIDKMEYDEADLVEISIPLNMPYQERFTEFERCYGEVQIDGKAYTYVKRKINGDQLLLKCIPNTAKQELATLKNDVAHASVDGKSTHKSSQQKSFTKNLAVEYDDLLTRTLINKPINLAVKDFSIYICFLLPGTDSRIYQPPNFFSA